MNLCSRKQLAGLTLCIGLVTAALIARADRPGGHGRQAKPAPPDAASSGPKITVIGDVRISGYRQLTTSLDLSSAHIVGPNTMIDVPEKGNASRLTLHADDITVSDAKRAGEGHIEMRGHLRYTLTQQTPEGQRKLNGTAGQGDFRRDARILKLGGGVQCDMSDPRLEGPGTLHTGAVTIDTASAPYLYVFEGESGTNELRFTPKPRSEKQRPDSAVGQVHLTHWETGKFQAGKIAKFDGALVVVDLQSRAGAQQGQIKGRHIRGDFAPSGAITQAQATDNVQFQFERPTSRKGADGRVITGREKLTGTCADALYEPDADRFTLDGDIDATLTEPLSLSEPAKLLASHLVVTETTVEKRQALRYELKGAPNHRRLEFTPRPPEPVPIAAAAPGAPAAPSSPVFALGSITLTGFQTAVLEPGQKIDIASDGKQALLLDTSDAKTHSSSHMETHHFSAALSATGGITEARADGPVSFHIQQPGRPKLAKTASAEAVKPKLGVIQSLDGNAARALYKAGAQERTIALQGPFTARVTDPESLDGPGNIKGLKDDTLSLDLVAREFTFDTPNSTMTLDFTPHPLAQAPTKGPVKPGKKGK